MPAIGSDVHDGALPSVPHLGGDRLDHAGEPEHVGLEHGPHLVQIGPLHRAHDRIARVVHEDVDLAGSRHRGGDRGGIVDVERRRGGRHRGPRESPVSERWP